LGIAAINLGTLKFENEDFPAAEEWLEKGVSVFEELENPYQLAHGLFLQAFLWFRTDRLEGADAQLRRAISLVEEQDPNYPDLANYYAVWTDVLTGLGRMREAEEARSRYETLREGGGTI
jgi:tetratricopeptide (TPR) repeat protein